MHITDDRTQTEQTNRDSNVLPFSRERLGRGARITEGARILASRAKRTDSPVYFPGDPRLKDR